MVAFRESVFKVLQAFIAVPPPPTWLVTMTNKKETKGGRHVDTSSHHADSAFASGRLVVWMWYFIVGRTYSSCYARIERGTIAWQRVAEGGAQA